MPSDDPFAPLREALAVSPTNVPLRLLLGDQMLAAGHATDAETLFKEGLTRTPNETRLKLGLARAFLAQGKHSAGIVICEALTHPDGPAEAYLLLAKLLLKGNEPEKAAEAYRHAVDKDPTTADAKLADEIGAASPPTTPYNDREIDDEDEDDDDRKVKAYRDDDSEEAPAEVEKPKQTFADVGGMDAVKEEIRLKIIYPLAHADLYKAYGKAIGGGLLMYGPPGCGKTHLARATAGEVKAGFISVGLHDVMNMWLGNSEKNLHAVFEQARRHTPCVLFFDEVDAMAASRADFRQHGYRQVINQFLSEMDGVDASNDGVLILAATNAPWHMDSAFRRPGRFDRILFVPPPDAAARAAIIKLHVGSKPQEKIDYMAVAKTTAEYSGADLKAVVDRAVEAKLKEAMKSGLPKPLSTKDLLTAAGAVKPSTREWLADARNYAMYSNDGGQYDDLASFLKIR